MALVVALQRRRDLPLNGSIALSACSPAIERHAGLTSRGALRGKPRDGATGQGGPRAAAQYEMDWSAGRPSPAASLKARVMRLVATLAK